jgi:hypothetical protein
VGVWECGSVGVWGGDVARLEAGHSGRQSIRCFSDIGLLSTVVYGILLVKWKCGHC